MNNDTLIEYKNISIPRSLLRKSIYQFHSLSKEIQDIWNWWFSLELLHKKRIFKSLISKIIKTHSDSFRLKSSTDYCQISLWAKKRFHHDINKMDESKNHWLTFESKHKKRLGIIQASFFLFYFYFFNSLLRLFSLVNLLLQKCQDKLFQH